MDVFDDVRKYQTTVGEEFETTIVYITLRVHSRNNVEVFTKRSYRRKTMMVQRFEAHNSMTDQNVFILL